MGKALLGVLLIAAGILAFLQIAGYQHFGLSFWPVMLTLGGSVLMIKSLFRRWGRGVNWFGLAISGWITAIGLTDILRESGYIVPPHETVLHMGWPIVLIGGGLAILFGRRCGGVRGHHFHHGHRGRVRWGAVGDMHHGTGAWKLDQDLNIDHGIGDVKIDLTTATITDGDHKIKIEAGIGEILVRVPGGVNATVKTRAGIGGIKVFDVDRGGFSVELEGKVEAPDAKINLAIEAGIGIGSIRIVQGPLPVKRFDA